MAQQECAIVLAENVAASTTTGKSIPGGKFLLMAEATWGGGNVKVQIQSPNATWIDVPNSTLSANGMLQLELPRGQARVVFATGTALYAYLISLPQ